jgi:Galactose oxidase, central domain
MPFVWNPADGTTVSTPQPKRADGTTVNLFCSGHCFLPDGRLLVVGGHQADSDGLSQACLYDAAANTWTPTAPMTTPAGEEVRRWYPTATPLADGTVLVLSGSFIDPGRPPGAQIVVADLLQIWAEGTWRTIPKDDGTPLNYIGLPLYPRMHVAADGQAFMSGTNDRTLLLKTSAPGQWTQVAFRVMGNRDYCPAVMYDVGKIIYIGGGNDAVTHAPTAETEIIDLGATQPTWQKTGAMAFPRRQHNAVLLPDGTVLVLGGTRGGGGPNNGFNDLTPGRPVHIAELWNPGAGQWTPLAAESVDRCYHATAYLQISSREAAIRTTARGTRVVIGITGTCPYGIGSCWGGAYEALGRLEGVDLVSPVPDVEDSTAQLFLADDRLPPLHTWDEQLHRIVNGTYEIRGVEVTVRGSIDQDDGQYFLTGTDRRPPVRLVPLAEKIQWDHLARSLKPPQGPEIRAYDDLIIRYRDAGDTEPVTVTGPLTQTDGGYHLHVRLLEA